ncbi:MAG: class I mannose-6-phosphate isomerase [Clostridia bacterium]|nr:class I mannose-6-phosphate isomerase [Clostridia bacterium]
MLNKYPMKLRPVTKQAIWGGSKLIENYHKTAPFDKIAESWELTVRSDGVNIIDNGVFAGMRLDQYIEQDPCNILGCDADGERFPLLVKFLDAFDDLSVQVHPDDAYALAHADDLGKMEMWYIMEAEPGAQLVYGLKDDCTLDDFAHAVTSGETESVLRYVPVKAGECYFIPHGLVHAIGAGILIAEIQQNSNVTYRVYDYNRRQADGTLRQLHVAQAMDVVRSYTDAEISAQRYSREMPVNDDVLCDCQYFKVTKYTSAGDGSVHFSVDERSFASLLVLSGENGQILCGDFSCDVQKGESYFLPAGLGDVTVAGELTLLVTTINSI